MPFDNNTNHHQQQQQQPCLIFYVSTFRYCDRTLHESMMCWNVLFVFIHLDVPHIAKQHEFDLTIPTAEDAILTSKKKFRLEKKSFAVACYTTMTSEIYIYLLFRIDVKINIWYFSFTEEHIVKHIEDEFKDLIQYICVSTPDELQTSCSPVYVQIILRKTVNKKTYFLKAVAGWLLNFKRWTFSEH